MSAGEQPGLTLRGASRLRAVGAEIRGDGDPLLRGLAARLRARTGPVRGPGRSWDGLSADAVVRAARAGTDGARWACWHCGRLGLAGPRVRCPRCGGDHGGAHHVARTIR